MKASDLLGHQSFGSVAKAQGIDVNKTEDSVNVSVDMPGFDREDISVKGEGGYLTIHAKNGERETEVEVLVGADVKFNSAEAKVKQGVLKISLARE